MFTPDIPIIDMLLRAAILAPLCLIWTVIIVRFIGLRSFSKMAAFDFIVTIGAGSLLASAVTASDWSAFFQASLGIFALLGVQFIIAKLRFNYRSVRNIIENDPILLMSNGKFCYNNMRQARVTDDDVIAKLREANALSIDQVHAVVLETTGDISVLHGQDVDKKLMDGVGSD